MKYVIGLNDKGQLAGTGNQPNIIGHGAVQPVAMCHRLQIIWRFGRLAVPQLSGNSGQLPLIRRAFRTLTRGGRIASAVNLATVRMAAGCQSTFAKATADRPAIQPIANRRCLAGAGGFLKFGSPIPKKPAGAATIRYFRIVRLMIGDGLFPTDRILTMIGGLTK